MIKDSKEIFKFLEIVYWVTTHVTPSPPKG